MHIAVLRARSSPDYGCPGERQSPIFQQSDVWSGLHVGLATVVKSNHRNKRSIAPQTHTGVFIGSLRPEERSRSTGAARGHWSSGNCNHYKRDVSAWQEDRHRHRRPNAALNRSVTSSSFASAPASRTSRTDIARPHGRYSHGGES